MAITNTNLYRIHPETKTLQSVQEIDFADHRFKERYDIQEWLEASPAILGEKLLIIAKEKTYFIGTQERPDLIAIDKDGNIVIIELKRDDSGIETHWQAIKYASYWAGFSVSDILCVYADYINKHEGKEDTETVDEEYADQQISEFIEQESSESINKKQRIILISHRFSKEVITAVDWLIESYRMDIKCVQLIPYFDQDKETYYLQSNRILPLAGIDDYLIRPSSGKASTGNAGHGSRNDDDVTRFFETLRVELISGDTIVFDAKKPTIYSRWAGKDYRFRYYHFWYDEGLWDNWNLSYRIWFYNEKPQNKNYKNKAAIFLQIQENYLLQGGVTEKQITDLESELSNIFREDNEFSFKKENQSLKIERLLEFSGLTESLKGELLKILSTLISKTYNIVNQMTQSSA